MSTIERLVDIITVQYRWGLHPAKMLVALLAPLTVVWLADRRLRARTRGVEQVNADRATVADSPVKTTSS